MLAVGFPGLRRPVQSCYSLVRQDLFLVVRQALFLVVRQDLATAFAMIAL